jgi:hypothetical protein
VPWGAATLGYRGGLRALRLANAPSNGRLVRRAAAMVAVRRHHARLAIRQLLDDLLSIDIAALGVVERAAARHRPVVIEIIARELTHRAAGGFVLRHSFGGRPPSNRGVARVKMMKIESALAIEVRPVTP